MLSKPHGVFIPFSHQANSILHQALFCARAHISDHHIQQHQNDPPDISREKNKDNSRQISERKGGIPVNSYGRTSLM